MSKQEEIKQALAAATPGPWVAYKWTNDERYAVYQSPVSQETAITGWGSVTQSKENAHLIAKSPEYIAYLLEENERLRKELEEAQREAQQWRSKYDSKHALLVMTDTSRNEKDRMYREALEAANRYQKELEEARKALEEIAEHGGVNLLGASCAEIARAYLGQEGEGNQCK